MVRHLGFDSLTFSLYFLTNMATRRRSSATKSATATIKKSPTSVTKVSTTPAKRVNKVTRSAKVMPEVTETKANPKFTELRGLDFVILPLIYLEAFVVNILQNLSLNVPERVAIK
tara:strand:+ start:86 stop:430 length:345 start_codon:yes stop_codon:yes gene_type:complete